MSIFPTSQERFVLGVETLNKVPAEGAEQFPLLLSRIIGAIHEPGAAVFTPKEEAQLGEVLGLGPDGVLYAVQVSAFIFECAAKNSIKAPALLGALAEAGLNEKMASSFAAVWASDSPAYLAKLRVAPLGAPWVLDGTAWRLSLGMGSSGATAVKATTAVFDFSLKADRPNSTAAPATSTEAISPRKTADLASLVKEPVTKSFSVEFTRGELLEFFEKLDKVQQQVDALSS